MKRFQIAKVNKRPIDIIKFRSILLERVEGSKNRGLKNEGFEKLGITIEKLCLTHLKEEKLNG